MGTIHVSKKAGANLWHSGFPTTENGVALGSWFGEVSAGSPNRIVLDLPATGVEVGHLVRWRPEGPYSDQLRRIAAIENGGLELVCNAAMQADLGTAWVGGDLPNIQAGLDAVAALYGAPNSLLEEWTVEVGAGVYLEQASIGVAGTTVLVHRVHLADGAIIDGGGVRNHCLTTSLSGSLYWRILGGVLRNTAAGVGNHGANFAIAQVYFEAVTAQDCGGSGIRATGDGCSIVEGTAFGNGATGLMVGGYGVQHACKAWSNAGAQFASSYYSQLTNCWGRALANTIVFSISSGGWASYRNCTADGGGLAGTKGFYQGTSGGLHVVNCIAARCAVGVEDAANPARFVRRNNLLWQCATPGPAGDDVLVADPLFVAPDAALPDYRLRPGSPAIARGIGALLPAGIPLGLGMNGGFNG